MSKILVVALVMSLTSFSYGRAGATEQYAQKTGRECAACHLNTSGGGELTTEGKTYLAHVKPAAANGVSRAVHLGAGYVHLLVAILWFGTILYVHLVLKPAYASQGLPRSEVRVGLLSMVTMAVTGTILTLYRVTSLDVLLNTRFGILLLVKIGLFSVMVCSALVAVLVIGPRLRAKKESAGSDTAGKSTLTAEELAFFDGSEGRNAYFSYRGRIYDVSSSRLWKGGKHMGRHTAGRDLTALLGQAPHGEDKMLAMPCVGTVTQETVQTARSLHERVFYVMAYTNLVMVFAITFIVALWRWW